MFTYNILKILFKDTNSAERALNPSQIPIYYIMASLWNHGVTGYFVTFAHPTNSTRLKSVSQRYKHPSMDPKHEGSILGGLKEPSPPPSKREAN